MTCTEPEMALRASMLERSTRKMLQCSTRSARQPSCAEPHSREYKGVLSCSLEELFNAVLLQCSLAHPPLQQVMSPEDASTSPLLGPSPEQLRCPVTHIDTPPGSNFALELKFRSSSTHPLYIPTKIERLEIECQHDSNSGSNSEAGSDSRRGPGLSI